MVMKGNIFISAIIGWSCYLLASWKVLFVMLINYVRVLSKYEFSAMATEFPFCVRVDSVHHVSSGVHVFYLAKEI